MIEPTRLHDTLEQLARFSAAGPGVTRLAYDDHWCDAHAWLVERARAMGLAATCDAAGNLFFHAPDLEPGTPVVLVGSHLDSVRHGGRYDGAYGVVCGLLAAAEFIEKRDPPIVGMVTAEEEGSRFPGDMLGARALLGRMHPDEFDTLRDDAGMSWRGALDHARARGSAAAEGTAWQRSPAPFRPAAMIEMHIEQGPVLEAERLALGIVEHIIGYRRVSITVQGEPRHAGTMPMSRRRDALAAAAEMVLAIERAARDMGEPAVATCGNVVADPGLYNVVPGRAHLSVELRHVSAAQIAALHDDIGERCRAIAATRGVAMDARIIAGLDPADLSSTLVKEAEAAAKSLAVPHRRMVSGAGHDAMLFAAAGIPTVMFFVPSRGGVSHSPDEYTEPEQLWAGYAFLREFARRMSRVPEVV